MSIRNDRLLKLLFPGVKIECMPLTLLQKRFTKTFICDFQPFQPSKKGLKVDSFIDIACLDYSSTIKF